MMAESSIRILLVENDQVDRMAIERFAKKHSLPYKIESVDTLSLALGRLKKPDYDLILVDYLLADGTGLEILRKAGEIPVVIITGNGDEEVAVEAMRQGAYDYIIKDHNSGYLALLPSTINDALERKQEKMAKAESDRRYRTIVETVSDIIFQLDTEQRITFVNPAIRDLGYDPLKVIGQSIAEFLYPEDQGKIGLIATKRVGARSTRNLEVRFISHEGMPHWMDLKGMSVLLDSYGLWSVSDSIVQTPGTEKAYLGTLCIGRNITKRKQIEEALRESEKRHRTIMDNVPDAIVSINDVGIVESFSLAGEYIYGYDPSEVAGKKFNILVGDRDKRGHIADIDDFFGVGESSPVTMKSCEFMGCHKDGSLFPMDLSITRIHQGDHYLFIAIIRDITERVRTEKKMKEVTAELERSNRELQSFASIASHDLQEPLRKIITFGDRLQGVGSELNEQGRDYLQRMLKSAARMQSFIDDLLLFSRVASKAREFELTNLNEVVNDVLADLEVRIAQTKGVVNVEPLPTLFADPGQMGRLFQNLISNALKFHRKDVPPAVNLSSSRCGDEYWEIKVEDNGIGFDERHVERVFEPFERLHPRSHYEGTGMGLAICRKIVSQHHGEIRVESDPSRGTTFFVKLQNKQPPKQDPR